MMNHDRNIHKNEENLLGKMKETQDNHNHNRKDNRKRQETRQDKTRQDKTRQDKTRQDKTRQDKTRQGQREITGKRKRSIYRIVW